MFTNFPVVDKEFNKCLQNSVVDIADSQANKAEIKRCSKPKINEAYLELCPVIFSLVYY